MCKGIALALVTSLMVVSMSRAVDPNVLPADVKQWLVEYQLAATVHSIRRALLPSQQQPFINGAWGVSQQESHMGLSPTIVSALRRRW